MKKIDKDMIVLVSMCLLFSMFLFFDSSKVETVKAEYLGMVVKKDKEVTIYRKDSTINLPINEYLVGVVGCEVDATYEMEALKTQAIVARTYALRKINKGDRLTDDTTTQCFKDNNELKAKWGNKYNEYYERVKKAIMDTNDLAIYYDNKLIDAVYHSISNGSTESAKAVWGSDIAYLVSVDSSWDKEDSNYKKVITKDMDDFMKTLGVKTPNYSILSRDESGRVEEIMVGDKIFSGTDFRRKLDLRSTDFNIDINNDKVTITTYGYGHGVGLSQDGANYMAKKGYKYDEIIKHYYKGVNIK